MNLDLRDLLFMQGTISVGQVQMGIQATRALPVSQARWASWGTQDPLVWQANLLEVCQVRQGLKVPGVPKA